VGALRRFLVGETPVEREAREVGELARRSFESGEWPYLLEGTNMSLWWSQIPAFWNQTGGTPVLGTPDLADRVWVANRCVQLNSQQIASMPIRWHSGGNDPTATEPAWVSNPDPNWYPNGVADAVFAVVGLLYKWGFAVLYATDYYADGFPRFWTVLDSSRLTVEAVNGARRYRFGETILDSRRCVQIDRNPSAAITGTPALSAYAQLAYGALAAGNQSISVSTGGIPQAVIKSTRKLDRAQAGKIQEQWAQATQSRGGLPPVLPPELTFEALSFNPSDLALLETQEFDAKAIATAYGVPAVLLNMALQGGLTYQNPAALGEMWWRFELRPTAKRIADALSAQMLPRGQWITFEAEDTFLPLLDGSEENDPQLAEPSHAAQASPAQQPGRLTAVSSGGGA